MTIQATTRHLILLLVMASGPAYSQVSFRVGDQAQSSPAADKIDQARDAVSREFDRQTSAAQKAATPQPAPPVQGADLSKLQREYGEAIQLRLEASWKPTFPVRAGSRCHVLIRQIPGGEVIMAQTSQPCDFDRQARTLLERTVTDASPMPYRGFESVFQRQIIYVFKAPQRSTSSPSRPAAGAQQQKTVSDYYKALQARIMQAWRKPEGSAPGPRCTVEYDQLPGGQVIATRVDRQCFSDASGRVTPAVAAWRKSVETAGQSASPLPYPGYEHVFRKTFKLTFQAQ